MSIYNIALYAAIAVISLVFAGGLYCFALILLKVPAKRTTNAIKSIASRNRPSAAGFKIHTTILRCLYHDSFT